MRKLRACGKYNRSVVIEPARRTRGGFDDAKREVETMRKGRNVAVRVGVEQGRCLVAGGGQETEFAGIIDRFAVGGWTAGAVGSWTVGGKRQRPPVPRKCGKRKTKT